MSNNSPVERHLAIIAAVVTIAGGILTLGEPLENIFGSSGFGIVVLICGCTLAIVVLSFAFQKTLHFLIACAAMMAFAFLLVVITARHRVDPVADPYAPAITPATNY